MHTAHIAIGSNMGNRKKNCDRAIAAVSALPGTAVAAVSGFYQTEPVDYTDQAWFVNAVIKLSTAASPGALLNALKAIESDMGRDFNTRKFGPRIIDLDILLFDALVIDRPDIIIPHPRMHQRCFVLKPLCDIDPDLPHPVSGKTMRALLESMDGPGQTVMPL